SILIPTYNEENWVEAIVERVLKQPVEGITQRELVIVDDGSKDATRSIIEKLAQAHKDIIFYEFHAVNQGKGAAIRRAIEKMTGDICIIQDADWEYDPADYPLVLEPIIQGRADCVYGSRFIGSQSKRVMYFWHYLGNKFITLLSNMTTNLNLTDMETCYKAFRCNILKTIPIRCNRFGIEPEITAKIAKRKCRIFEVGISYSGRTYEEGKKITWFDGVKALLVILRFWIMDDSVKK
ncbi:MAG: glycosyltransferase family 2 protein, partial [Candidatus Omnitrophica bacterium]|nr:glycosyltransferase family 2 protein [Candidatus Omnitrophota bacterium]